MRFDRRPPLRWQVDGASAAGLGRAFARAGVGLDDLPDDGDGAPIQVDVRTRIRFSVMPERMAELVDIRTDPVADRIGAVEDLVDAGYEGHLDLPPVIGHEGWLEEWAQLLDQLDARLSSRAEAQCAAEISFLTHNAALHEINLGWHPRGEEVLWRPDVQEPEQSHNGISNVRYRARWKAVWVRGLVNLTAERTPWLRVRHAFSVAAYHHVAGRRTPTS